MFLVGQSLGFVLSAVGLVWLVADVLRSGEPRSGASLALMGLGAVICSCSPLPAGVLAPAGC